MLRDWQLWSAWLHECDVSMHNGAGLCVPCFAVGLAGLHQPACLHLCAVRADQMPLLKRAFPKQHVRLLGGSVFWKPLAMG